MDGRSGLFQCLISSSLFLIFTTCFAADTAYRPGYDAIVEAVDSVGANLESLLHGSSNSAETASTKISGDGRTMTITIPDDAKMSEEEIQEMLANMRKSGISEEQIRQAEELYRTGSMTVTIKDSGGDAVPDGEGAPIGDTPAMKRYTPGDAAANSRWAMSLGADMAVAAAYGFTTGEMIKTAGEAVKAYPHPLLLNNYGSMLMVLDPQQALFFFQAADAQQPDNPIFLTNAAAAFLELGDFDGAKRYAGMALRADSMFGPAHEVMAVVHLHDNNMELAVESTIKSARNCFSANTEHLFEEMREGIEKYIEKEFEDLKWGENAKFPVSEENMKLLYEVAKAKVPSNEVNSGIDTPGGQVTIPPFPSIAGAKDLAGMTDYFEEVSDKYQERRAKRKEENDKIRDQIFARSLGSDRGGDDRRAFEIDSSLRQKQAYYLVKQYYHEFEIARIEKRQNVEFRAKFDSKYDKDSQILEAEEDKYTRGYYKKHFADYAKSQQSRSDLFDGYIARLDQARKAGNADEERRLHKELEAKAKAFDERYKRITCQEELAHLDKLIEFNHKKKKQTEDYLNEAVDSEREFYAQLKQFLEEFWLKAGGIMKYVSDPLQLELLNYEREYYVDANINMANLQLGKLSGIAKWRLKALEDQYNELVARREQTMKDCQRDEKKPPQPGRTVADIIAQTVGGPGAEPTGERITLSTFEEENDYKLPEFGIEASVFDFSVSANADFDKMKFTTSLGSPVGGTSTEKDAATGKEMMVETISGGPMHLFGVQADFQPLPPRDGADRLKQLFTNKTALGYVATKLMGPVSISHEQGTYQTVDPKGRITDRGKVTIKSKGIGNSLIGYSEATTVTTSAAGVSSKSTAKKFKFIFLTVTR